MDYTTEEDGQYCALLLITSMFKDDKENQTHQVIAVDSKAKS